MESRSAAGARPRASRILRLVLVSSTLALALSALAPPAGAAPAPTYYMYQGERIDLRLDVSRLAVRYRSEIDERARLDAAEAVGVRAVAAVPTGVARWHLLDLATALDDAADAAAQVAALGAGASIEFAAPVFHGSNETWVTVTPHILVRLKPDFAAEADLLLPALAPELEVVTRDFAGLSGAFELAARSADGFEVLAIANRLAEAPEVAWAEPDMQFSARSDLIPNDTQFGDLWGIRNTGQFGGQINFDMDGDEAWDITTGSASIKVLVLDTGVQLNHPDLNVAGGRDFTTEAGNGGPVNACDNHGTAVAGCIAAVINNALGVVGISPACPVLSARIGIATVPCNGTWSGQYSWTAAAIDWGQQQGCRVTNNSNSYGQPSNVIADAYERTRDAGVVHFASAGNDGQPTIGYPSSLPTVNAVAALAPGGFRAGFSNYGVGLDLSAPGQTIWTTDRTGGAGYGGGDYLAVDGTSFSSPYAAGVAALMLSVNPNYTAAQAEARLYATCRDLGATGYDTSYGWGFVNARAAANILYALSMARTGPPAQIGSASEAVSFAASMQNRGLASDTYDITLNGAPAGWSYSYTTPAGTFSGPSTLSLSVGAAAPITISLDSQGNPGSATITLRAVSQGDPTQSSEVSFTKLNGAQVLVVDDDGGETREVRVASTLAAVGRSYGVYDPAWGALALDDLNDAGQCVIWLTGTTSLSLDAGERALITSYLAGGGKLLVSGQEIAYDLADPASPHFSGETIIWFVNTLRCLYTTTTAGIYFLTGVAGDLLGNGLSFSLEPAGPYGQSTPDVIGQLSGVNFVHYQNVPSWFGGTHFTDGNQKLVFLSFGLEGIYEDAQRELLVTRVLEWFGVAGGVEAAAAPAAGFTLAPIAPNPVLPPAAIRYRLAAAGPVSLRIYDVSGRHVRTLVDGPETAAEHRHEWNGRDEAGRAVPSGVYFYRLEAGGRSATARLVVVR